MLKLEPARSLLDLYGAAGAAIREKLAILGAPGAAPPLSLSGESAVMVSSLAAADEAGPGSLVFAAGAGYLERARAAGAAAFIVPPEMAGDLPSIVCPEPRLVFAALLGLLAPFKARPQAGGEPVFADRATVSIGEGAAIASLAFIGRDVVIGPGTAIGPQACLEDGVIIGADCHIHPGAVLRRGTRIGDRVEIHSRAVIGDDGFGYTQLPDKDTGRLIHYKNAHLGGVVIEDDVEIGAGSAIDRGLVADTLIGRGTKIDNLVQIGHNCRIGRDCIIVSQVGIGGHTELGDRVFLLGQAGLGPGVKIGADAILTGQSGLGSGAIPPGRAVWSGTPVSGQKEHLAALALSHSQLPRLRAFFQLFKKADSFMALKEAFFAPGGSGEKP